ncbi:type II secretion system F family protein [Aureisphaera galaxeae]|uniref:type II secretion system F family protein n=1 Tax=Aureisphaera galaxeae TaxID=1538023 RepID=UPI00234FFDBA|nr:type II secretion system F family protein [Aureisphaera galaxeae]MDC8005213.1 type II secretion system F family protein [Aureisphaera galaxeae]
MGIKLENIADQNRSTSKEEKVSFMNREITLFGKGMSHRAKEDFYAELSVLLNSGVNLKTALDLISDMQRKKKDQSLIQEISNEIVAGSSLYDALEKNSNFSSYEYQAIKIGERTGQLPKIVDDLREYFNRKNELRRQLVSSLSYPVIVLILAVVVVFFMLRYVVPMFVDIFKQNQVELPWLTQQIVKVSTLVTGNGLVILLVIGGLILLVKWASTTEWYYRLIGKFQLKIPTLGNYFRKVYLIQFTQAMALLTNAKIPVVNGIALVREMIRFYPLEKTLHTIEKDLIQGSKLNDSFAKHPFYDKKMIALLKVAEETNQTEYIFQKLYDQYAAEIKYKGQMMTTVFNFMLTLIVGIIVAVILIAMYLPMFKLSSLIG